MTAPERSPLAEQDEFPDPEVLAADVLAAVEIDEAALGREQVDTDASDLEVPCIECYVPPGRRQLNRYGDLDISFVYTRLWAPNRRTAQNMLQQARRLLLPFASGGVHRGVQVFRARETTGPGLLPLRADESDRCVESGWTFQLRRHRGPTVR